MDLRQTLLQICFTREICSTNLLEDSWTLFVIFLIQGTLKPCLIPASKDSQYTCRRNHPMTHPTSYRAKRNKRSKTNKKNTHKQQGLLQNHSPQYNLSLSSLGSVSRSVPLAVSAASECASPVPVGSLQAGPVRPASRLPAHWRVIIHEIASNPIAMASNLIATTE